MSERWRLKEQQEKVHARATELRAAQKAKNDEYYDNRRFSRRIREVGAGKGLLACLWAARTSCG